MERIASNVSCHNSAFINQKNDRQEFVGFFSDARDKYSII